MHSFCPAFNSIAITSVNISRDTRLLARTRCKSWTCPYCAPRNRSRWQAFLFDVLPCVSEVWSFHTLTLPSWVRLNDSFNDDDRTIASLSLIRGNWDKLMKRVKRQCGKEVQYFRVFEKHQDGVLHSHFLLSHEIPLDELHLVEGSMNKKTGEKNRDYSYWRFLKDIAPECGFGAMTSTENLEEPKKAVGYATKYMTKEDLFVSDAIAKYRIRRFQSSQGIGSQDSWGGSDDHWEVRTFIDRGIIEANDFYDVNKKKEITAEDLDWQGVYPPVSEYAQAQNEQDRRKKARSLT